MEFMGCSHSVGRLPNDAHTQQFRKEIREIISWAFPTVS